MSGNLTLTWSPDPATFGRQIERRIEAGLKAGGTQAAKRVKARYQAEHKYQNRTGRLAGSASAIAMREGGYLVIGLSVSMPYAGYIELGTRRNNGAYRSIEPTINAALGEVMQIVGSAMMAG